MVNWWKKVNILKKVVSMYISAFLYEKLRNVYSLLNWNNTHIFIKLELYGNCSNFIHFLSVKEVYKFLRWNIVISINFLLVFLLFLLFYQKSQVIFLHQIPTECFNDDRIIIWELWIKAQDERKTSQNLRNKKKSVYIL